MESYFSKYDYLPKEFIDFILEKYVKKTEYKDVAGKEVEYALEKAKFNALYGMSVTNNIKDEVIFDNETGWKEVPLTNDEILNKLKYERKQGFLSFAWGVWVTAHARNNLLENVIKLDDHVIYCDTDSIKVINKGFNAEIINDYNKQVEEKIKKASEDLKIPIEKFKPKDKKGRERMLGIFEHDADYKEFITQGAKKYAYTDKKYGEIHITCSGVPKERGKSLEKFN